MRLSRRLRSAGPRMRRHPEQSILWQMRITYAVTWQEAGGCSHSGRLELGPSGLLLTGVNGRADVPIRRDVSYRDITGASVGRTRADRLGDRPTLVVERRSGGPLRIAGVVQAGIVSELAERLAARVAGDSAG